MPGEPLELHICDFPEDVYFALEKVLELILTQTDWQKTDPDTSFYTPRLQDHVALVLPTIG